MDSKYCYPNSNVLINKLNIQDPALLHEKERDITWGRSLELSLHPIKGKFDLKHLQAIHKKLFGDIYPWAGKIREVPIAKTNLFCLPQYILPMSNELFSNLSNDDLLKNLDKSTFIDKLAFYMGEVNALHPFREGNGRTQRIYFTQLSESAGYQLNFDAINKDQLLAADIGAMNGQYDLLIELLTQNVYPIQKPSIKTQLAECKAQAAQTPKKATTKKINHDRDHDSR